MCAIGRDRGPLAQDQRRSNQRKRKSASRANDIMVSGSHQRMRMRSMTSLQPKVPIFSYAPSRRGQSGHGLTHCTCLLLTQSGHGKAASPSNIWVQRLSGIPRSVPSSCVCASSNLLGELQLACRCVPPEHRLSTDKVDATQPIIEIEIRRGINCSRQDLAPVFGQ
jgi:hypothetical protein